MTAQAKKGPRVEWNTRRTDIRLAIGRRIAQAREVDANGTLRNPKWSQPYLAARLNSVAGRQSFTQAFVSRLEKGKTPIHLEYLVLLSETLDLPVLELIEPVLVREYGMPLLDILLPFLTRSGELSQAGLERITSGARSEMARILLERKGLQLEQTVVASGSMTRDPEFLRLVRDVAQLGADGWSRLRPTIVGLQQEQQRQQSTSRRKQLEEGLLAAARRLGDRRLVKDVERYVSIGQESSRPGGRKAATKKSIGGSKKKR